jgi:hypothetical protein
MLANKIERDLEVYCSACVCVCGERERGGGGGRERVGERSRDCSTHSEVEETSWIYANKDHPFALLLSAKGERPKTSVKTRPYFPCFHDHIRENESFFLRVGRLLAFQTIVFYCYLLIKEPRKRGQYHFCLLFHSFLWIWIHTKTMHAHALMLPVPSRVSLVKTKRHQLSGLGWNCLWWLVEGQTNIQGYIIPVSRLV